MVIYKGRKLDEMTRQELMNAVAELARAVTGSETTRKKVAKNIQ